MSFMPEALAIVVVFFVAVGVYISAWLQARNPAQHDPRQELARLKAHEAWLRERLQVAREENWANDMVAGLADELAVTSAQCARVGARSEEASAG